MRLVNKNRYQLTSVYNMYYFHQCILKLLKFSLPLNLKKVLKLLHPNIQYSTSAQEGQPVRSHGHGEPYSIMAAFILLPSLPLSTNRDLLQRFIHYILWTPILRVWKGQYHKIFCFRFFSWIIFPKASENNFMVIFKFFWKFAEIFARHGAPLVSTTLVANLPPYRYQQVAIMGTISDCLHLKVNFEKKMYLCVNSTTQRCPNKIFKTFLIEDFFYLHLELQISLWILKKFETALMGYPGAWGKLIHEKTWSRKFCGIVPLNKQ
jgi:hypothetical protein